MWEVRCKVCERIVDNCGCDDCKTPLCGACFQSHYCPGGGAALTKLLLREVRTAAGKAVLVPELQLLEKCVLLLIQEQVVPDLRHQLKVQKSDSLDEQEIDEPVHIRISVGELNTEEVYLTPADVDVEVCVGDSTGQVVLKVELIVSRMSFRPLCLGFQKLAWPRLADVGKATVTVQTYALWIDFSLSCKCRPDGQPDLSTVRSQRSKTSSEVAKIQVAFQDSSASWLYDSIAWCLEDRVKEVVLNHVTKVVQAKMDQHLPQLREAYCQAYRARQIDEASDVEGLPIPPTETEIAALLF